MTVADLVSLSLEHPKDLASLCARVSELLGEGQNPVLLAGGTDFMVEQEMRKPFGDGGVVAPFVLDVSRMAELRGISIHEARAGGGSDVLVVGAATSFLEMRRDKNVVERAGLLERMARDVGAVQIQARGTLGGNLATASPAADGVAALAAYDAVVLVRSVRGERRIPFDELQTGYKTGTRAPDEIIVAIEIRLPKAGSAWYWRKVGTRRAQSISKVALAGVAEVENGQVLRCGLGMASVAPVTTILSKTRSLFLSRPLRQIDDRSMDKAVESDISPIDDVRSTRSYRLHVACSVVRDFARFLAKGHGGS